MSAFREGSTAVPRVAANSHGNAALSSIELRSIGAREDFVRVAGRI